MIYLLDTNIFLRVLVREDEKAFVECNELLKRINDNKIKAVTLGIVLAELAWTLKSYYRQNRSQVAEKIEGIINLNNLKIVDKYNWVEILGVYRKVSVKFVDAAIATMDGVVRKEWTVVTYDDDFRKLPVKWLKPGEV